MEEIWKGIEGYEDYYEVSNLGRVKALDRVIETKKTPKGQHRTERILGQQVGKYGYVRVTLCRDGICKAYLLHRIVAKAFIPNPEGKPEVNHINGAKDNNQVDNLEWVTPSENSAHAHNVLHIPYPKPYGQKLNKEQVKAIRADTRSQAKIAKDYGVSPTTISHIKLGKYYKKWLEETE